MLSTTFEADRPTISQLRRLWHHMATHVQNWSDKYRRQPPEWQLGYAVPDIAALPAPNALFEAVVSRRKSGGHPVFLLAYILDLRLYEEFLPGKYRPHSAFFDRDGMELQAVRDIAKRLCDDQRQADMEVVKLCMMGSRDDAIGGLMKQAVLVDGWKCLGKLDDVIAIWRTPEMRREFPELSKIVDRVLTLHCTSCGVESLWSILRNITRENRSKMATEKTKKITVVGAQERLERAIQLEGGEPPLEYMFETVLGF